MGHKVHPVGFRLGIFRNWDAKWFADKLYVTFLQEDLKIRKTVRSLYPEAGVSQVEIDRQANNVTLTIHTARPGILIGRGGQRVDEMRNMLEKLIGKKVQLNIREVQQPELDAYLVARSVADQMERRVAYRRAMKQSMQRTIQAGAKGMRVRCAGRLDGAEIARKVIMHEGRVPLHTIRADVDYGITEAHTMMGRIGVKVWIYKGEILPEKEEVEQVEAVPAAAEEKPAVENVVTAVVDKPVTPPAPAAEEQPKPVRRTPRPRTAPAPETGTTTAAPAAEEQPKPVRRTPRPRTAPAPETGATTAAPAAEDKPKTPRRPRSATVKPKEGVTGDKAPPADTAEKQGEGNATT